MAPRTCVGSAASRVWVAPFHGSPTRVQRIVLVSIFWSLATVTLFGQPDGAGLRRARQAFSEAVAIALAFFSPALVSFGCRPARTSFPTASTTTGSPARSISAATR